MKSNALKVAIVVVAMVLPGLAVADVMISGTAAMTGTQNDAQFYFAQGPNFATAAGAGFAHLVTNPGGNHKMAEIDFQGAWNQSIFAINIIEVQFASGVSGTFYLNFTGVTAFPAGSTVYLSSYPVAYSDFTGVGDIVTPPAIPGTATPVLTSVGLNIPGGSTVSTTWTVTSSSIIYISFYMPSGQALGIANGETLVVGTLMS